MATIDSRRIIDDIIAGKYVDDHPSRIVEYINQYGKVTWGVTFGSESKDKYTESSFVRSPRVIWDRDDAAAVPDNAPTRDKHDGDTKQMKRMNLDDSSTTLPHRAK